MSRLLLLGVLWILAIALVTAAALVYFNGSQFLHHKKEMWKLKHGYGDDEE
jgi:hypothetical protein